MFFFNSANTFHQINRTRCNLFWGRFFNEFVNNEVVEGNKKRNERRRRGAGPRCRNDAVAVMAAESFTSLLTLWFYYLLHFTLPFGVRTKEQKVKLTVARISGLGNHYKMFRGFKSYRRNSYESSYSAYYDIM